MKGVIPKAISKCMQPWHVKSVNHCELGKVQVYNAIHQYWGELTSKDTDKIIEVNQYPNTRKQSTSTTTLENKTTLEEPLIVRLKFDFKIIMLQLKEMYNHPHLHPTLPNN